MPRPRPIPQHRPTCPQAGIPGGRTAARPVRDIGSGSYVPSFTDWWYRLISRIRERLDDMGDTGPLTAPRIVGALDALDAVVETDGPYVPRLATRTHTDEEIATALGSTEKAFAARLRRYDNPRY